MLSLSISRKVFKGFISNQLFKWAIRLDPERWVAMAYQSILGREVDPEGLESYASQLKKSVDFFFILDDLSQSEEHWQKSLVSNAYKIIHMLYEGLLGRGPDTEGLNTYMVALATEKNLVSLINGIGCSDEHWMRLLSERGTKLVHALYLELLGREPDEAGLEHSLKLISKPDGLVARISGIAQSQEFIIRQKKLKQNRDPSSRYNEETPVFIHIQKTAGTALRTMLKEAHSQMNVYDEHADNLYQYSPSELSAFSAFFGHFNHDSLSYIPRMHLKMFTFVRQPKERLISLYYFWHAHEPTHASYLHGIKLANELSIMEFYQPKQSASLSSELWNHMTWAIMGHRQWKAWQMLLTKQPNEETAAEIIDKSIRPIIQSRLREYIFIGLQENFEESVRMLFNILQLLPPKIYKEEHSLELLMEKAPNFKRNIKKNPIDVQLDQLLDYYVQLDNIVYEESKKIFLQQLNKYSKIE